VETAFEQARLWKPRLISLSTAVDAEILRSHLRTAGVEGVEVVHGRAGAVRVATHPDADFVVSAIVGVAGLEATYEAVKAGKTVGLANKECLVAAGELITAEARRQGKPLLPIDSEHNAVHQCLRGGRMEEVERIWLTASGGPFLYTPKSQFSAITVAQALNHPTWKMGQRITIDSATLMNKGFEVIEACRLFNLPPSRVQVIVHPQSTIHSMVEFVDGSILAQFSVTDMRLPILYALTFPDRVASAMHFPVMDLRHLEFLPPDMEKFPCLSLAYEAAEAGGAKTVALNAADEVAVAAFLQGRIGFDSIPTIIGEVLAATEVGKLESITQVLAADSGARAIAHERIEQLGGGVGLRPVPTAARVE
jgi:1-deoxy-D-xylulose-5-phosphate reductoisomerase